MNEYSWSAHIHHLFTSEANLIWKISLVTNSVIFSLLKQNNPIVQFYVKNDTVNHKKYTFLIFRISMSNVHLILYIWQKYSFLSVLYGDIKIAGPTYIL